GVDEPGRSERDREDDEEREEALGEVAHSTPPEMRSTISRPIVVLVVSTNVTSSWSVTDVVNVYSQSGSSAAPALNAKGGRSSPWSIESTLPVPTSVILIR